MRKMTIQNQILEFNNDFQVQSLRAKYNRPTFFELTSFLEILVRRDAQQNNLIPFSLKKAIITRTIKIDSIKTSCEFPIMLIDCDIQEVGGYKKLQIILENKVSSIEGSSKKDSKTGCNQYDSSDQTSRYFMGFKCKDDKTYQFFVYLTPLASKDLEDYYLLSSTQKYGKSDEYILVNCQDMEILTIPDLANSDEEDRNQLSDFLNKYQDLIAESVLIANPSIEVENYGNCESLIKNYINMLRDDIKQEVQNSLKGEQWEEFFQNDYVYDLALLYYFYKQNSRLIIAAMKILVESSNISANLTLWQDLYEGLTTNVDRTKYKVTIDNFFSSYKYLNKREVVKYIVQNINLEDELIQKMNEAIPRVFLKFEDGESQEFDRSRYEGLEKDEDRDLYVCRSLRDEKQYSLYVSNQWKVLPLSDDEKKDEVHHPSGKGGNFGKLLDFFLKNKDYNVKIEEEKAKED